MPWPYLTQRVLPRIQRSLSWYTSDSTSSEIARRWHTGKWAVTHRQTGKGILPVGDLSTIFAGGLFMTRLALFTSFEHATTVGARQTSRPQSKERGDEPLTTAKTMTGRQTQAQLIALQLGRDPISSLAWLSTLRNCAVMFLTHIF